MKLPALFACLTLLVPAPIEAGQDGGPLRILFLGHKAKHHPSDLYYPMLAQALGPDAIYFDYHTSVEEALGDADYLNQFDGLLLYANHDTIEPHQHRNLTDFVENGGGFIPVHCASFCFRNEPSFIELCGGQFKNHKTGIFTAKIVAPEHPAMADVREFEAWDETYVHHKHADDRSILMVREPAGAEDNITRPEPWTWTREQGKGRVFYTASGHDHRVWSRPEFHQLLKSGILWAVGDERRKTYEHFIATRTKPRYEKRDHIPNYEKRPEALPYQFPMSPEDSLAHTQVPVGWRLELFAAEPQIINPICLAWDERGRLWVAETIDYPNELRTGEAGDDSIKILEDTDGDGRCDKVTVFAEGLNIPTALTFANGGLIVHQAPQTLFLKDTDGDDKADIREVLLDGWGIRDTHAGPSNLRYGIDNQVWGTVGYDAFNGTVGDQKHRFGMGVYRFAKDGSSMEFLHQFTNNTWGLGFNEAGDVFGSTANNAPSFFGGIPATLHAGGRGLSARAIADTPAFHPITPNIRQVDALGAYTAGAGHAFANSNAFPGSWRGRMAFVAGPTGNLLGMFRTEREGAGFKAENAFALVRSTDEWFSPVAAEVGPDGHLWIADWYNFIIQHNPAPTPQRGGYQAKSGKGNAHVNPNRDREHGRIYRLIWNEAPKASISSLAEADPATLVAALADPNQFWRLTAQRLLVDRTLTDAIPALKALVTRPGIAASHALWSLHGLDALDPGTHRSSLVSVDPALRRNAIRALPHDRAGLDLLFESSVINDPDLTTRLAAFVALAQMPTSDSVKTAIGRLLQQGDNRADPWLSAALDAAAARHQLGRAEDGPFKFGPNLLAGAEWSPRQYRGEAEHRKPATGGVNQGPSLRIDSKAGADTSFHAFVEVKPNTRYRLRGKVRTKGVRGAMGALFNIHELQDRSAGATRALQGDNDWTELTLDFNTRGLNRISINCLFGGWGRSTGTAWYDGLELRELIPDIPQADPLAPLVGDPTRGKAIFMTHQVAACNRCHQLGGQGGGIGPALDGIAAKQSIDYLRESLFDPGAAIAEGYPGSVSPMPPADLLLNSQEIEDVLSFLQTLR